MGRDVRDKGVVTVEKMRQATRSEVRMGQGEIISSELSRRKGQKGGDGAGQREERRVGRMLNLKSPAD